MLDLQKIKDLAREYTKKEGNPFYRKLYGLRAEQAYLDIKSIDGWHALPPLRKQDMIDVPFNQRLFVPPQELQTISVTSGTTGGPPLFQPRSYQGTPLENLTLPYGEIRGAWLAGILQYPHEHEWSLAALKRSVTVVQFDPQHIRESLQLAILAGTEVIIAQTYFVSAMCDAAEESGLAGRIKLVIAAGEAWTRSEFLRVQSVFKNAPILCNYGIREAGTVAHTGTLNEEYNVVYRPKPHVYLEMIDTDTGVPVPVTPGAEGELLITTTLGTPSAFPLLRYRVGDLIRIESVSNENGGNFTFKLIGRADQDLVKFPGGVLRVDELIRVVESLSGKMTDQFEAHCHEEDTSEGPKKRMVMHVEPQSGATLSDIARDFAGELHMGPSSTYADGVKKSMYLPLSCVLLEKGAGTKKRKRIVKHW
ncbi:phenylacetate--CoA ligase family protein [Candidatus Kaiserbacteria bacterium]|nr:phenylacetate--CoA ligase family protein [Candidatus Kaiserbacteria bacterium]